MNDEHCFGALNNQFDAAIPFEGKTCTQTKGTLDWENGRATEVSTISTMIPIRVITVTSCCELEGGPKYWRRGDRSQHHNAKSQEGAAEPRPHLKLQPDIHRIHAASPGLRRCLFWFWGYERTKDNSEGKEANSLGELHSRWKIKRMEKKCY